MVSIARLQTYLRFSARRQYEAVAVPPFTLFFHPTAALPYFNYAIPNEATGGDLQRPLARLRAEFNARGRQPRLEFIEAFAPDLAAALHAEGFVEEARLNLMICTVDTYRPAPPVPGLAISVLTELSPLADAQAFLATQRQGFDPGDTTSATVAQAEQFLQRLGEGRAFLARLDGQPVGAGTLVAAFDGLAEVAGIATLEPFRRRGVASVLTSEAVRTAFSQGVEVALLTAADEHAERLYKRIGFHPYATRLAYGDDVE